MLHVCLLSVARSTGQQGLPAGQTLAANQNDYWSWSGRWGGGRNSYYGYNTGQNQLDRGNAS